MIMMIFKLKTIMTMDIKEEGKYIIPKNKMERINKDFLSTSMNEKEILDTIKEVYTKYDIILDPHSAIGFGALNKINIRW